MAHTIRKPPPYVRPPVIPVEKKVRPEPKVLPPYPTLGCYERRARYFRDHLDMELPTWYSPAQAQSLAKRKGCRITRELTDYDMASDEFELKLLTKQAHEEFRKKRFNK